MDLCSLSLRLLLILILVWQGPVCLSEKAGVLGDDQRTLPSRAASGASLILPFCPGEGMMIWGGPELAAEAMLKTSFVSPAFRAALGGGFRGDVSLLRTNPFSVEKAGKQVFLFLSEQKAERRPRLDTSCPAGWPCRCRQACLILSESRKRGNGGAGRAEGVSAGQLHVVPLFMVFNEDGVNVCLVI